ncbi:putative quinol monooxygenase [Maridesulfovibrio sp. FT414]|uniref:putative quinol monooxygenase n=1 Tax=Maridesulfovibrio sp. FT414 TaxID=2979469 RepID=UPI003D806847
MIYMSASFQAREGKGAELEKLLSGMIPETAKEEGVLEYRLHRSLNSDRDFYFYETYADQAALDSHLASPHYKSLVQNLEGVLASDPVVEMYTFLGSVPENGNR